LDIGTHYFQQVSLATDRYTVALKKAEGCGQNLKLCNAMACDFLWHNPCPCQHLAQWTGNKKHRNKETNINPLPVQTFPSDDRGGQKVK